MKFGSSKCVPPPQLSEYRAIRGIIPEPSSMKATERNSLASVILASIKDDMDLGRLGFHGVVHNFAGGYGGVLVAILALGFQCPFRVEKREVKGFGQLGKVLLLSFNFIE